MRLMSPVTTRSPGWAPQTSAQRNKLDPKVRIRFRGARARPAGEGARGWGPWHPAVRGGRWTAELLGPRRGPGGARGQASACLGLSSLSLGGCFSPLLPASLGSQAGRRGCLAPPQQGGNGAERAGDRIHQSCFPCFESRPVTRMCTQTESQAHSCVHSGFCPCLKLSL